MKFENEISSKKELLTERETASMLALSQRTLANWRSQNKGPKWIRLSARSIRYPLANLTAWVEEQKS